jgi:protein-S-isoprenylcysteine O-methyltransferase Ste14
MSDLHNDTAGVIARPPLIYVGGLALGWLLHRMVPLALLPARWTKIVGGLLCGLGAFPVTAALIGMLQARTNPDPHQPTTALVTSGVFRYTRNPIYLSFTLLYAGIATLINSLSTALLLPVVVLIMRRGVIAREERYLERKFGAEYAEYKARVRRWL